MIPSGYKDQKVYSVKPLDGSGDLTFSRASSATRVASNGLIEKVRTNVMTYSQDFSNANWVPFDASRTGSQTDPNGGTTASLYTSLTNSANLSANFATASSSPYTFSIYIKGTSSGSVSLRVDSGSTAAQNNISYTTSWQRFTYTFTAGASTSSFVLGGYASFTTGEGIYVAFAQAELGDIATDYIATTTAAVSVGPVSGLPRLDYLNSSCPRLLLEPQRTNLVTYSEQLNTGSGGTTPVTANTAVSPDGYTNADTIGTGYWTKSTSQSAGTYTLSVFAKYQSAATFGLYIYDGAYYQGTFNLQTGVATPASGSPTVSMVSYGNGWYRCTLTATTANTISEVGFGSGNFYGYGLQLEAGAYATSYIPTLGAAVTRGADLAQKTSASALIGQTEGTIFWEIEVFTAPNIGAEDILVVDNGAATDLLYLSKGTNNSLIGDVYVASVRQAFFQSSVLSIGTHKAALAYANNNTAFFVDGVQVGTTDTSCSVPAMSRIQLGNGVLGPSINKTAQLLLFPTRLTNAQLAELTTL